MSAWPERVWERMNLAGASCLKNLGPIGLISAEVVAVGLPFDERSSS